MEEKDLKNLLISSLMERSKDLLIDEIGKKVFGEEGYLELQKKVSQQVIEEFKETNKDE